VKVTSLLFVVALAAGTSAAAQSTTPQTPPKPTAPTPSTQTPATQTPAPAQVPTAPMPAVPASRMFTAESGVMFSLILPTKTADFEAVLARVKEALTKSQDPKRKQQALGWRVLKGVEPGPGGNIVYMWLFEPAVKDVEYSITSILTEAFPNEAQDLWAKYTACFAAPQSMLNLSQVLTMGPAGTVTVPK
jgi:pyruvate/2-oxoglutarate dehydrogenase complex dihydrolipoamide acyltransferase (E2) component